MSTKKTVSNTFTVSTVEDGESAPYYFLEWFAWSNDPSTNSVTTAPTIGGTWATSIPAQGSYAYLWRKSIRYVWQGATRTYSAEAAQYFRMSGLDGTSIKTRGQVASASQRGNGTATLTNGTTITMSDGDAVTQLDNGHLYQWVTEGGGVWLDLGQFKGQDGVTHYSHVAWATNVTISGSTVTVTGFVTTKSPNDTTHIWMGTYVDTNSGQDSANASLYTWSNIKGESGTSPYFADLNNEMDAIQCKHDGSVIADQTVSTIISMWKGSAVEAFVIDNIYRNGTQLTWGSISNGVKASKSGSTVSIEFGTNASIADIDDFKITIHSYNDNTVTRELHFTINGVRANAIYRLVPSHSQIVKKKDGTYEPSVNITCSVEKTENGSTSTPSSSEYTLEKSVNGGSYTTYSATAASSITSDLKFRLTVDGVVVDLETIPLVSDGDKGNEGKGYKAVVTRNNFTELNWATYGESGHSETWSDTSSTRGNCKTGDWFIVVGTATDTKNYHIATYECSNDSGNLVGTCINHQITKDGVSYCFVFTKAAARIDENNIVTAELAGYAYKYVGGVRSALTSTTIRYGYILTDSDTYADTTTNSSGFFDVGTWFNGDDITDYGKNSPSIFAAIVIGGTVVHAEMITISVKGSTGSRGKVGRFFYYEGEWNDFASTDSFFVNDAQAPYFYYNNNYWVFNPETNGTYTKQNMGTPSSSSLNWKLMTNDFKYIITEAIFGSYAHFGASIINGDYLISQYGYMRGFGNIKTSIVDSTQYIYVDPNDMFGEDDWDLTDDKTIVNSSPDVDKNGVTSYTLVNEIPAFNLVSGRWYSIVFEGENLTQNHSITIALGTSASNIITGSAVSIVGTTGIDGSYKQAYINFKTTADYSNCRVYVKMESTGDTGHINWVCVRYAQFVPNLCIDMKTGKLAANNIIARGQLYADSFVYEVLNANNNNEIINVGRQSIVNLGSSAQGSTVTLPAPSASKGRRIEVFNHSSSWKFTWVGATSSSTCSCADGSGLGYRVNYDLSLSYMLFYCDGTTWWCLKSE